MRYSNNPSATPRPALPAELTSVKEKASDPRGEHVAASEPEANWAARVLTEYGVGTTRDGEHNWAGF